MSTYDPLTKESTGPRKHSQTEILESGDANPWKGPFQERDKYGQLTGTSFVRCRDCGREAVTSVDREHVLHADDCRFAESDDDDQEGSRDEPTRSEPADFGAGESTGGQQL